ncbi:MAG: hypothetical protein IPM42_16520 [Saprospiraceae bacterium]|nr:hypothetical protein [Saprospiraceae bacterium]
MNLSFAGIDYGAKLAGTTAITYLDFENTLITNQTVKGQDSDVFLSELIERIKPDKIFIDAPLSLPSGYFQKNGEYFYREADKALQAMSPMFLGGLTARAMSFNSKMYEKKITCYEVYPAALVRSLPDLHSLYKKKEPKSLPAFTLKLKEYLPAFDFPEPSNWHQADSLLAWWTGLRYVKGIAKAAGNHQEGLIWI